MMSRRDKELIFIALGAFAGGFFCAHIAQMAEPAKIHEAETLKETVTVVQTMAAEAETKVEQVDRVIERKIAVPCKCRRQNQRTSEDSSAVSSSNDKDINVPDKPSSDGDGILVMDERIIERALSSSERLRLDAVSAASGNTEVKREFQQTEPRPLPDWQLSVLAGWNWHRKSTVYGVEVSRRIIGPVSLGVWGLSDRTGRGAAGISASVSW